MKQKSIKLSSEAYKKRFKEDAEALRKIFPFLSAAQLEGLLKKGKAKGVSPERTQEVMRFIYSQDDSLKAPDSPHVLSHSIERSINMMQKIIISDYCADSAHLDGIKVNYYFSTTDGGFIRMNRSYMPDYNKCIAFEHKDVKFILQLFTIKEPSGVFTTTAELFCEKPIKFEELCEIWDSIYKNAISRSKYKGKCIEYGMEDKAFVGMSTVDIKSDSNIVLSELQTYYQEHFISRLQRGGSMRMMFNGIPGSGKTETIRNIAFKLMPEYTFVIPKFKTLNDLKQILNDAMVFDKVVIILDDIDLYLGNRDKGTQTSFMGEFLSFFDGVKKRNVSILASTNNKKLVDSAAERPGRFNIIIDFDFLNDEEVVKVVNIHFPKKYHCEAVYSKLLGSGMQLTGAFLANLAANLEEIEKDDDNWSLENTLKLIDDSYSGFYKSQSKPKKGIGFAKSKEVLNGVAK